MHKERLDPEDARLLSYFTTVIENATKKLGKKQQKLKENEMLTLNQRISEDIEDVATEKVDMLISKNDTLKQVEQSLFIEEALSLLTPQQQKVIITTVLKDQKERYVAEEMDISQQAIQQIKKRALNRLEEYFNRTSNT